MKKSLFAVFALAFFCSAAFAEGSVINAKVGLDLFGNGSIKDNHGTSGSEKVKDSFSFSGEVFHNANDFFKIGIGVEYLTKREVKDNPVEFNFLPAYLTAEFTPIKSLRELYLKGNLGYNILFDIDITVNDPLANALLAELTKKGGLYYAFGAGYAFDFGLILEAMYSYYYGTAEYDPLVKVDFTYDKFTFNVGYRFNI